MKYAQNSFTAGELSPAMFGRIDDSKYAMGLAECTNFICRPEGPVENRSGFGFVRAVKDSSKAVRLLPFVFTADQTMVVELGDQYARFHTHGQTLMNGAEPYEIVTPYAAEDVMGIHYAQSADVITLVHPNYAPRELRRYGALDWRLETIDFSAPLSAPTGLTATYTCHARSDFVTEESKTMYNIKYVVTALKDTDDGVKESAMSAVKTVAGNLYLDASKVDLTWTAVSGADRYRVYKTYSGVYGYIGETESTSFTDDNKAADESISPPRYESVFASAGDYPGAVSYYEQRRIFAGTTDRPQFVWMTRPGTETDMSYTLPTQADNRIKFRIAAAESSRIRHIVPMQNLLLLTAGAEFRVTTANDDMITPTSIGVKPQSYVGASTVQPVVANSTVCYAAERGGHVRELGYNWQSSGYVTGDMSVRCAHLFDGKTIVDMALQKAPYPIVWCVNSEGELLGCTYIPEQVIGGWHRHRTANGFFESIACVAEGDEDILYAVIRREINGETVRYIERMHERLFSTLEDCFFVDCGATYEGNPVSSVSGLDWLEGQEVAILADGKVMPRQTVTEGVVSIPITASKIQVGIPILAQLYTMPVVQQARDGGFGRGVKKNVTNVYVRVYQSSAIKMGPALDLMTKYQQRTSEPYGSPPNTVSEEVEILLNEHWTDGGQVYIQQENPLPLVLCSVTSDIS